MSQPTHSAAIHALRWVWESSTPSTSRLSPCHPCPGRCRKRRPRRRPRAGTSQRWLASLCWAQAQAQAQSPPPPPAQLRRCPLRARLPWRLQLRQRSSRQRRRQEPRRAQEPHLASRCEALQSALCCACACCCSALLFAHAHLQIALVLTLPLLLALPLQKKGRGPWHKFKKELKKVGVATCVPDCQGAGCGVMQPASCAAAAAAAKCRFTAGTPLVPQHAALIPPPLPLAAPAGVHTARDFLSPPSQANQPAANASGRSPPLSAAAAAAPSSGHTLVPAQCTAPQLNSSTASKHAAAHFRLLCIHVATPQPNQTSRSLAPHCFHPATPPCPAAPLLATFLACARQRRAAHEASTVPVTGSGTHARRLAEKMKRGQQCKNREQNQLCVGRVQGSSR